jgi:hypothetical protein
MFGKILSFSGYFTPLHDGPFKNADASLLRANDPTLLVRAERAELAHDGTRFFVSTGPAHSHWLSPAETIDFARELRSLHLPVQSFATWSARGEWKAQLDAGLAWALG